MQFSVARVWDVRAGTGAMGKPYEVVLAGDTGKP